MLLLFLFILGLSVGSFLNVLIDRLPKGETLFGRSYCDHCKKKIHGIDLVPVFSYLALSGKCRFCGKKISLQYPAIEILTGFAFVFTFLYLPANEISVKLLYLGIISLFLVIFFADWKYQLIPDEIQIALLFFIVILKIVANTLSVETVAAALFVALPIFLLYQATGTRGMGFGDVKLAALLGFLLGLADGLIAIYFGFLIGSVFGLVLIFLKKKTLKSKIAFGPFLLLGGLVMIFFGSQVRQIFNLLFGF